MEVDMPLNKETEPTKFDISNLTSSSRNEIQKPIAKKISELGEEITHESDDKLPDPKLWYKSYEEGFVSELLS